MKPAAESEPQQTTGSPGPIKAVIFDMDNTLFDFVAAKRHSCDAVAQIVGRADGDALFEYFLKGSHGFESHENIRDYLIDRGCYGRNVFERCTSVYDCEKVRVLVPYPKIHEVLARIRAKNIAMAIVTDAHHDNAIQRLEKLDLARYFEYVITTDMTGHKKPAPEPFLLALRMLGTCPRETLLIGDSVRRDISPGKLLGFITAHAKYGDRNVSSPDRSVADFTLNSVQEITKIIP